MTENIEILGQDDVIKVDVKNQRFMPHTVFTVNDITTKIETNKKKWIDEGVEVEVLKVGSSAWQKGKLKVKVTVEFCPDEPESMLDDFRNK